MKSGIISFSFLFSFIAAGAVEIPVAPPAEFAGQVSSHRSPLRFDDGSEVKSAADWSRRRAEILQTWHRIMGEWPPLLEHPKIEKLETTHRENFTQHKIRLQIAPEQTGDGYLLIPEGNPPFPAVFVPYYDPETSAGLSSKPLRDFAFQLTKRGFVSLSIGSPGGDARKPVLTPGAKCQPLSYLGYVAANAWNALAGLPEVDAKRIGIVGHSYGGKWSMFGSCLWDKYACAVWSDPGLVFDEKRQSVNYWEPWYLGLDRVVKHKPGLVTETNPRSGAYKVLVESGHDLVELHALMAPRPFLVSGGSEDYPARWPALQHAIAVNQILGHYDRVAMTNREKHDPTEQSNAQIYAFFEKWIGSSANHAK
jgi:hypothetical protein